jgi:hypothetical protein
MSELKPYQAYSHRTHGICADYPNLYGVWLSMKSRCENPNRPKFKDYGYRGIEICEEWQDAGNFAKWAFSNGYKQGLQIDRIDNDGNYEPSNCRFVTPKENSRNRRNTKLLTINGETKSVAEWCENIDISPFTVYWWIREKGVDYAVERLSVIA